MDGGGAVLVIVIAVALVFDFTNGFHDTANVVATSISTRALPPRAAVGFAATFAASIFHYVGVGPNRAEEEEDNLHEEKDEVRK